MNLPFHVSTGSQTSILISESDVGLSVAATRQKAGRRLKSCCCGGGAFGWVNSPAGTRAVRVMDELGSARVASESQVAAASGAVRLRRSAMLATTARLKGGCGPSPMTGNRAGLDWVDLLAVE